MSRLLLAANTHTHTGTLVCRVVSFMTFLPSTALLFSLPPSSSQQSRSPSINTSCSGFSLFFSQMFSTLLYVVFIISFRSIWPEGNQNLALAIYVAHAPLFYSDDPLYSRSLFISNMMFPVNMSEKPPLIHHAYVSRQYRDTWLISFSFSAGGDWSQAMEWKRENNIIDLSFLHIVLLRNTLAENVRTHPIVTPSSNWTLYTCKILLFSVHHMLVELIENKCPCLVSLVRTFIYSTRSFFSPDEKSMIDPQRDKGLDILLLRAAAAAASWRRENLIDTFEKSWKERTYHTLSREWITDFLSII